MGWFTDSCKQLKNYSPDFCEIIDVSYDKHYDLVVGTPKFTYGIKAKGIFDDIIDLKVDEKIFNKLKDIQNTFRHDVNFFCNSFSRSFTFLKKAGIEGHPLDVSISKVDAVISKLRNVKKPEGCWHKITYLCFPYFNKYVQTRKLLFDLENFVLQRVAFACHYKPVIEVVTARFPLITLEFARPH